MGTFSINFVIKFSNYTLNFLIIRVFLLDQLGNLWNALCTFLEMDGGCGFGDSTTIISQPSPVLRPQFLRLLQ